MKNIKRIGIILFILSFFVNMDAKELNDIEIKTKKALAALYALDAAIVEKREVSIINACKEAVVNTTAAIMAFTGEKKVDCVALEMALRVALSYAKTQEESNEIIQKNVRSFMMRCLE